MVKKKKPKKRKPKGKRLSEVLEKKAVARARADEAARVVAEAAEEEDDLASEPPPAYLDEDEPASPLGEEAEDGEPQWAQAEQPQDDDAQPLPDEAEERDSPAGQDQPLDEGELPAGDDEELWDEDEDDEDDEQSAAQMGHRRYVIAGFFGLWMVGAYIFGRSLQAGWSKLASKEWFFAHLPQIAAVPHEGALVSRESISLLIGAMIAAAVILRYYFKPSVRTWSDEVAAELTQVKWPNRKEVGNHTVVVLVSSTVLTVFLTLLDRVWAFVTNLIYSTGA